MNYNTYGSRIAVTNTGRATSPGRVTRAVTARGNQGRPLPIAIQCHPKALSPTTRNPECVTSTAPWGGAYLFYSKSARARGICYFTVRKWPMRDTDKCALYIQGTRVFTCNDINQAMGWKRACEDYGFSVSLFV